MKVSCAIIPARGGSKGVPRKNLRLVAGKPLIAWTIEVARASAALNRIIVTTEDPEIAEVARHHGAEVPFMRPPELARDDTPGIEPVLHALRWLDDHEAYRPEMAMLLQPTSPLCAVEDIEAAINIAITARADAVVSVSPVHQHPYWMKRVTEDGRLTDFLLSDHQIPSRRQELPPLYAVNGAIYLADTRMLLERQTFYTDRTYAYVMPSERSLDIDTAWDLYLGDLVLRDLRTRGTN